MFISPMLLHQVDKPFDDGNFITEMKFDGIRLLLSHFDKTTLYTRHHTDCTTKFKELLEHNLPYGTILDGEVIVTDHEGKPDFEAVMQRFSSNKSNHKVTFMVFDILYYRGKPVMDLPQLERKHLLSEVLPDDSEHTIKVPYMVGKGISYFNAVKQNHLEGIVLKSKDSTYKQNHRSKNWLKVINYSYSDVKIAGFKKNEFGLLLNFDNGRSAGVMEFMPMNERKAFYQVSKQLIYKEDKNFVYIDPIIECRVKYRNLTKEGKLRIPVFDSFIFN
jgi:DNA ligase 1